jgi:biotin carboxyl carrier protein
MTTRNRCLNALLDGEYLCSPMVGYFEPLADAQTGGCLGMITRRGVVYRIMGEDVAEIIIREGKEVAYGEPLARVGERGCTCEEGLAFVPTDVITAPCDGYMSVKNSGGVPYFQSGDVVHPGDVVAVIEVMKLGIDVTFSGEAEVIFDRYCEQNLVRRGDVVCYLKPR